MKKLLFVVGLLSGIAQAQDVQENTNILDYVAEIEAEVLEMDLPETDDAGLEDEDMTFRKYVGIPKGYVYNPKLGTTHDYCSYSPDSYLKANFRGPCARHDICYDSPTDKKKCDVNLLKDMYSNCDHAYGKLNPVRYTCHSVAKGYFAAVVVHH
ncbi:phospholipase A2 [Oligoflexus tunisiensis]|uniref:phospholipase A2 n=1 Tax=Oligoflexus tunisiensis TaxID=708132 RepID=UPI000B18EF76|nr:phospholipase A2 [Oligoflexus tunisiensis]